MDLNTLYERSVAGWTAGLAHVDASHWDRPTPCSDWSVRTLVNHVAGEDLWTVPLVQGSTIEDVGDRFDGDVLGDDPVAVAGDAAAAAVAAVAARLPSGGTVRLSYGEEQLDEYVRQLVADHLVHGWDLAVSVGGSPRLDPDVVAGVAGWFAEREEIYRSVGAVGPRTGTHDDPQDDLIAGFGRDPRWSRG
jgi:uncharacterized protein (TIGR03086 family)